ncbi:MAG TPA: regulatory iron-sulfur-containing complex subunit RicT [Candidatus Gastranaerophilales bacterium]|nr:regulatory iron-sulfur-containing complex subunit RicT [Candidatus Gastranaerophilales bacterium]
MYKYGVRLLKNRIYPVNIPENTEVKHGQLVLINTEKGQEVAKILRLSSCVVQKWGKNLPEALPFIRIITEVDKTRVEEIGRKENVAFNKCEELIEKHKLPMRLVSSKYTFDEKKLSFYYTAPHRIDFRELLKDMTQTFRRVRIDLRHIGVRDETSIIEGMGICGRQFCCSSFLKNFESINIKLVKDQGMPVNPSKISGTCGRLLCCLNYEYSNYIDAAAGMPPVGCGVMTSEGLGKVAALHFLHATIVVKLEDGRVKEFNKKEIEMLEEDITNIEIDYPMNYAEEEATTIDISSIEDDDQSFTSNI